MKIKRTFFLVLLVFGALFAEQYTQDSNQQVTTQPEFLMGPHVFGAGLVVFCGSGCEGAKEYTLSRFDGGSLMPFAKPEVVLNYKKLEDNPFYDKKISHLKVIYNLPTFVTADQPNTLYYISGLSTQQSSLTALSISHLNDADGNESNGIVNFTYGETSTSSEPTRYVFAALKAHEGNFGDTGSGIALLKFKSRPIKDWQNNVECNDYAEPKEDDKKQEEENKEEATEENEPKFFINTVDAQRGMLGGNKAVPLDIEVTINDGLDYIKENTVDLFWEENFNRLYVALQVKTKDNADPNQGACALLVGHVWKDKLLLHPIVPSSVFSPDADNIIGAVGPNRYVSLHKVRALHTTTGMQYLVVVGGNGRPEETHNKVFAVPMANLGNQNLSLETIHCSEKHGAIGKRTINPSSRFFPGQYGRFIGRYFDDIAQDSQEFYTADDAAAKVGGDSQLPNAIKEIFTARDCVVVLVEQDGKDQEAGAFYSQAIFDKNGCIAAWSTWKHIPGSHPGIMGLSIDPLQFKFTFFEQAADRLALRANAWHLDSVKTDRSMPHKMSKSLDNELMSDHNEQEDKKSLSFLLNELFPQTQDGVQGLFDFDYIYPGLSGEEKTSLLIATGNKKIVLIQTGTDDEKGIFRAHHSFNSIVKKSYDFQEMIPADTRVLIIEGDALDTLGPIATAEIVSNDNQSWLVVGGVGGIAVLADEHGSGWKTKEGIGKGFSSLNAPLYFQPLGNYAFVKKLRAHSNHLYILTDEKLDYSVIDQYMTKNDAAKTLITQQELGGCFSDMLISDACIMLGTANGLFFGAEDIAHAPSKLTWQKIDLPGLSLPILKFFCITHNGREAHFIKKGQIYVLSGSVACAQSEVHRLFLDDGEIQCVRDYGFKNYVSRFISFGGFRNNFATDGLIHLSTRSAGGPLIHVLPAFVAGKAIASSKGYGAPLEEVKQISNIRHIAKNSATGSWLVGGDFGVYTYE